MSMIDITGSYGPIGGRVDVGAGHELLSMDDGSLRFAHTCDRHLRLGDGRDPIRIAPALQYGPHGSGHDLISIDPLHVEPSIICEDCGTHGWIREGRWVDA